MSTREFVVRGALVAGSLLFCAAALELSLRAAGWGALGRRDGHVVRHVTGEFDHTVVLNSLGLRGRELAPKAPDELRILALGDSFTYGLGVAEEASFVRQTEARLAGRATGAGLRMRPRVVNAGVGGGPFHQAAWLRETGLALDPDVVVQAFFIGNDLYDDLAERERAEAGEDVGPDRERERPGLRDLARRSRLLDWTWSRLVAFPAIDRWLFDRGLRYGHRGLFRVPLADLERRAWRATLGKLGEIADLLRARGVDYVVLLVPTADQVRMGPRRPPGEDQRQPNRLLADFLGRRGIAYLDLLPAMESAPARDGFYYRRDLHWTPAGHAFAAERIADSLWERLGTGAS